MKYLKNTTKKRKHIRKNPVPLALPFVVPIGAAIVDGLVYAGTAAMAWWLTDVAQKEIARRKEDLQDTLKTIPKEITLEIPLDWLAKVRISGSRAIPKNLPNGPGNIGNPPPQPPILDPKWFQQLLNWLKKGMDINVRETVIRFYRFLSQASKPTIEFIQTNINRLDLWEKMNPWKYRFIQGTLMFFVFPALDNVIDYIKGSTEPFYVDTSLSNFSQALSGKLNAYPLLKQLKPIDNVVGSQFLYEVYASTPLQRQLYSYNLQDSSYLQNNASAIKTLIQRFHVDSIGDHNRIYVPQNVLKKYFSDKKQQQTKPFGSFLHLQGCASSCNPADFKDDGSDINGNENTPRKNLIYSQISYALTKNYDFYNSNTIRINIFNPKIRLKLQIAISIILSQARKYWTDRYDLACCDPSIPEIKAMSDRANTTPTPFRISDRNVPTFGEEGKSWASFAWTEGLVPISETSSLPDFARPAFYYDILRYIQEKKMSNTIKNLTMAPNGNEKLTNISNQYSNIIYPIKKTLSPIEEQRIAITSIWTFLNASRQLRTTPITENYYKTQTTQRNSQDITYNVSLQRGTTSTYLEVAIDQFLYKALGFEDQSNDVSVGDTANYAHFKFMLGIIEAGYYFESNTYDVPTFTAGIKKCFDELMQTVREEGLEAILTMLFTELTALIEKYSVAALFRSQLVVMITLKIIDWVFLEDAIGDYFKSWLYNSKDGKHFIDPITDLYLKYFVDKPLFTYDEIFTYENSNTKVFAFDRIFVPNMSDCTSDKYLNFCESLSQLPSSRMLGGVIFYHNLDTFQTKYPK
jgi:hypothetical protein